MTYRNQKEYEDIKYMDIVCVTGLISSVPLGLISPILGTIAFIVFGTGFIFNMEEVQYTSTNHES